MPLRQTTTGTLYLYVNLLFTFPRVPVLWNVNVLWEERQEKHRIIRQDAKEMHGIKRGRGGHAAWGGGRRVKSKCQNLLFRGLPKSSLACVLQRACDWGAKQLNQWGRHGYISFRGPTMMNWAMNNLYFWVHMRTRTSTYFRGSKQISCPCLCPSSCSWGLCQSAPLAEGKGLHLVYIPTSNPGWTKTTT